MFREETLEKGLELGAHLGWVDDRIFQYHVDERVWYRGTDASGWALLMAMATAMATGMGMGMGMGIGMGMGMGMGWLWMAHRCCL